MILGTSGSSLIENLLAGRGLYRAGNHKKCKCGQELFRDGEGEGLFRAGKRN